MPDALSIAAAWERSDDGAPEECATFGMFVVHAGGHYLTEGHDDFVNRLREGPLVAACHAAEWLAWNWWRLRWEAYAQTPDWRLAHAMTAIGQGYVWPNIAIMSDGEWVTVRARPSSRRDARPFRYIADRWISVTGGQFEGAVDRFLGQVLDRLTEEHVAGTNLERLWADVLHERRTPDLARRRRLEALLGMEPDGGNPDLLNAYGEAGRMFGQAAVNEVAADRTLQAREMPIRLLRERAGAGFVTRPQDAARLRDAGLLPASDTVPAWRRGMAAARLLRDQERLGDQPLDNHVLAQLAAVSPAILDGPAADPALSFTLDDAQDARMVLRSKWPTGRRFEVARLVGDRAVVPQEGALRPATRAYTYRQKMQRAFAAELLCPFDAVEDMLGGDYSPEAQTEVAQHFDVSDRTVLTMLVNNGRLQRGYLEAEGEVALAV